MSGNDLAVWIMFLMALYWLVVERWLKKARRRAARKTKRRKRK